MPTFKVTDPRTGRTLKLTGDSPPSEKELEEIFSQVEQPQKDPGFVEKLLKGKALPTAGAVGGGLVGGLLGPLTGIAGAGVGAASGEVARQTIADVLGVQQLPPPGEAVKKEATAGLSAAALEATGVGAVKLGGKLLSPLGKALAPAGRQLSAQVLQPSVGMIKKELTEKGISETLEEMGKRGITGTAREIFERSGSVLKTTWDDITKFLKLNKGKLPKVQMDDVVNSIDDDIARHTRLGDTRKVKTLQEMKKRFGGAKSFDEAYQLIKDFGQEARNVYKTGKEAIDVKPHVTSAYKLMADTGRRVLRESADDAGFTQWGQMMNDYHFWSNLKEFAKSGTAKGQTAISSVRGLLQRGVPWGITTAQKVAQRTGDIARPTASIIGRILGQGISQPNPQRGQEQRRL